MQVQVGICPKKIISDQIQNGRPSAIIDFNMHDIWQTEPNSWTITNYKTKCVVSGKDIQTILAYKTKCAGSGRDMPDNFSNL